MEWTNVAIKVIELVAYIIIVVLIPAAFNYFRKHFKNSSALKLIDIAEQAALDSIQAINSSYVNTLKEQGKFDDAAKKIAFEKCKSNLLSILNDTTKKAITTIYGDLDTWIETIIESNIDAAPNKVFYDEETEGDVWGINLEE